MLRTLIPVLALGSAVGIYFLYIQPERVTVAELQAENEKFIAAVERANKLSVTMERLQTEFNAFDTDEELVKLERLLPSSINEIQLFIDILHVAETRGVLVNSIEVKGPQQNNASNNKNNQLEKHISTVEIDMIADYDTFKELLADFERSLQLFDIQSIEFSSQQNPEFEENSIRDLNSYEFTVKYHIYFISS